MFKGNIKFKRPKLTVDQKALKKAVTIVAKEEKSTVKENAPKLSGALKYSIGYKVKSSEGNAFAVIGTKTKYAKMVAGKEKIPNKYAMKEQEATGYLDSATGSEVLTRLRQEITIQIQKELNGK